MNTKGDPADVALSLVVDAASLGAELHLPYLLSFDKVDGIVVEKHVEIVERPGEMSSAVVGADRARAVSLAPLEQFKRIAVKLAQRPGCSCDVSVIERAMAFAEVARHLDADAVVSPAGAAFQPSDAGLIEDVPLITVDEALALIGAHVRQREEVTLSGPRSGLPRLVQRRTEVYPLTARAIISSREEWLMRCLRPARSAADLQGYADAVFKRVGQALRGRDGVHEALRVKKGRAAVLEALYHFDVVLTSGVGALDALARAADVIFEVRADKRSIAWQRKRWIDQLQPLAPDVAAVVAPGGHLGAKLRILTETRNSIHGIPLDECLHAQIGQQRSRVEHRVMIGGDLAADIRRVGSPLEPLNQYGILLDGAGTSFLDIGKFTEQLMSWVIEIIDELMRAMNSMAPTANSPAPEFVGLERIERDCCVALARVGSYPCRVGAGGLRASPSLQRKIMRSVYESRSKVQS